MMQAVSLREGISAYLSTWHHSLHHRTVFTGCPSPPTVPIRAHVRDASDDGDSMFHENSGGCTKRTHIEQTRCLVESRWFLFGIVKLASAMNMRFSYLDGTHANSYPLGPSVEKIPENKQKHLDCHSTCMHEKST